MIQDIKEGKLINHYEEIKPDENSYAVVFNEGKLLCRQEREGADILLPEYDDEYVNPVYLFSIVERKYFLCEREDKPEGFDFHVLNSFLSENIKDHMNIFAAFTAYHLWCWYTDNRFCGRCGTATEYDHKERALRCPKCGNVIYPRINPAVIIGVTNGDRILLTKYATGFRHNALVAGFTEIGETLEETVEREVMEETGLKVKNIRYYKSQPWGIAQDVLMGFYCDVDGDDTIKMDASELKYARWVKREDIILQPGEYSLTNEMMKMFKEGRK